MWKYSDLLRNIYKKTGTHDPFKIAMYFDIPTYYVQISSPLAKAIYLYGQPIILLSDKLRDSSAKYYICGHELGHIFKHTGIACAYDSNMHFRSSMEREADLFSFELCNSFYCEENGEYASEIKQLNYSYGVPENFYLSKLLT
ncbi:ImmA/IrrE family metallo-endopeptidase [Ligilactobacillus apodemi]|uniref:ImmA/IrrE family metallo-endopeptidase n=1 Tax=Ligilactobacillus apodemi TaxID=307126 RepID=UPI00214AE7D3|nr:ImmA/IrrE family metallo-endopeptidase [Ligilactobacillus apodemi]MCR1900909.1 ImmA/IrrE family metallo-endopeptidase [Ligilactobacillus apodemi]